MNVRVLLFAALREVAGAGEIDLALAPAAPAGAVLEELTRRLPERRQLIERSALAINEEYAQPDSVLHEGDTVAVIPPVSGG